MFKKLIGNVYEDPIKFKLDNLNHEYVFMKRS